MSTASSPRKPWESNAVPSSSSTPLALPPPPSTSSPPSDAHLSDAYAVVPTTAARPGAPPSTSSPSTSLASPSPDPNHLHSSSPYPQSFSSLSGLPPSLYPGHHPPNPLYPGQPGLPLPYSPISHIGSSIQSFGRFSQLLQLNFDALHMAFSSLLRLFDSASMLRAETLMLGQTFTTLNVFAWVGKKVWRLLEWAMGRKESGELERGWKAAAGGVAGMGALSGELKGDAPSFFSGWTWTFLFIAIGWSAVRWMFRMFRRRLFPELAPSTLPLAPNPAAPATAPADPAHPSAATNPTTSPVPPTGIASPPYPSPYTPSMGYNGYGMSGGYGGGYGMGGYGGGYAGAAGYSGGLSGYGGGGYGGAYSGMGGGMYGTGYGMGGLGGLGY